MEQLIEPDHSARAIWEFTGRLDLGGFYAPIAAAEGEAGRTAWDLRVLICLLRQFRLRGLGKVLMELLWACVAYNVAAWMRLIWRPGLAAAG
ncbi:MAG: hypothetical protein FJ388_18630 [Verrucomicrobia bacterium]|nr:hypothetical protein [Verrucomicrobiota bacterium]